VTPHRNRLHHAEPARANDAVQQYTLTTHQSSPQSRQLCRNKHCASSPQLFERLPHLRRLCCRLREILLSTTNINFTCSHLQPSVRSSLATPLGRSFMSHLPWSQLLHSQSLPPTFIQQLQQAALLGHPHEQASPQETKPFWQQYPESAYPHARFYPELDLYTDRQPITSTRPTWITLPS
jgi:hypothetical protein